MGAHNPLGQMAPEVAQKPIGCSFYKETLTHWVQRVLGMIDGEQGTPDPLGSFGLRGRGRAESFGLSAAMAPQTP